MPSSKLIFGFHFKSFLAFEISAQVQSGSPGLLGIKTFSPPSNSVILLTETVMVDEKEDDKESANPLGGMGGMY